MRLLTGSLMAAGFGMVLAVTAIAPASAQGARSPAALGLSSGDALLTDVQYRRGGGMRGPRAFRGNQGFRGNRAWRGGRHYGGGRYYRRGPGIGVGVGLAAGALIGGAFAAQAQSGNNAIAYCSSRFQSYDPASGTYLGYDGFRHACP